jgi:hypothetical protein
MRASADSGSEIAGFRMRPRTLRGRLAAGAAAAIVVAIGVLGLSVGLLVNRELRSSLDRALERRAADVARLSASAPARLTSPGACSRAIRW